MCLPEVSIYLMLFACGIEFDGWRERWLRTTTCPTINFLLFTPTYHQYYCASPTETTVHPYPDSISPTLPFLFCIHGQEYNVHISLPSNILRFFLSFCSTMSYSVTTKKCKINCEIRIFLKKKHKLIGSTKLKAPAYGQSSKLVSFAYVFAKSSVNY